MQSATIATSSGVRWRTLCDARHMPMRFRIYSSLPTTRPRPVSDVADLGLEAFEKQFGCQLTKRKPASARKKERSPARDE